MNSFIYWIGSFNAKKGKKMQASDEFQNTYLINKKLKEKAYFFLRNSSFDILSS